VCNLTYKWEMKELFNLALKAYGRECEYWNEEDDLCRKPLSTLP
jgi:hypothetical protein